MYLHSILSNVLAVFGVSLLFVLWHSNVLELSVLFPVILRKDVFLSIILSLPLYFRYQVKTGGGAASSFTTHPTLFMEPSIICNGLWSGCREIVLTGTVKCVIYIEKEKISINKASLSLDTHITWLLYIFLESTSNLHIIFVSIYLHL